MLKRILVVDDQPADQLLAKYAIRNYNPDAVIFEAFDGQEALELIETLDEPLDIILLDINMPRMNGFEFLNVYQKDSAVPVVVMLTSSDQSADRDKCSQYATVSGYEMKPVTVEVLKELERLVAERL